MDGAEVSPVTVVSSTQLTFSVPASLGKHGPVAVQVTTPAGQNLTRSDLLTRYLSSVGFTATTSVLTSSATFIRMVDVDGDGVLDLLTPGSGGFQLNQGNGDGTFKAAMKTPVAQYLKDIAVADLNTDNLMDVVSAVNGKVYVNLGQGNLGFATAVPYTAGTESEGIVVADVNGN